MKEIKAIIKPFMLEHVLHALSGMNELPGVTVSSVMGWGKARGEGATDPVHEGSHKLARKTKLEIVVPDAVALAVVTAILHSAHTGTAGDGKIFVDEVSDVIKIKTGEHGEVAV
jgi:nitrogen regulatory protein P-II 1